MHTEYKRIFNNYLGNILLAERSGDVIGENGVWLKEDDQGNLVPLKLGEPYQRDNKWYIVDPESDAEEEIRMNQSLGIYADERNRWWKYDRGSQQRKRVQYQLGAPYFTMDNEYYTAGSVKAEYDPQQDVFKAGDSFLRHDKEGQLSSINYDEHYKVAVVVGDVYRLFPGRARITSVEGDKVKVQFLDEKDTTPGWANKLAEYSLKEFKEMVHNQYNKLNPYKKYETTYESGLGHGGRKEKGQIGKIDTSKWDIDLYDVKGGFLLGFIAQFGTISINIPAATKDEPSKTEQYVREYARVTGGDNLLSYVGAHEYGEGGCTISSSHGHSITTKIRNNAFDIPDLVPTIQRVLMRYTKKGIDENNSLTNYILGWAFFRKGLHIGRNTEKEDLQRILSHFTKRSDIMQAVKAGFNGKIPEELKRAGKI